MATKPKTPSKPKTPTTKTPSKPVSKRQRPMVGYQMEINADTKIEVVEFVGHSCIFYAKPFDFTKYKPMEKIDWEHESLQTYKAEFHRYYDTEGRYLYTAALAPEINTVYIQGEKGVSYHLSPQHEGRV